MDRLETSASNTRTNCVFLQVVLATANFLDRTLRNERFGSIEQLRGLLFVLTTASFLDRTLRNERFEHTHKLCILPAFSNSACFLDRTLRDEGFENIGQLPILRVFLATANFLNRTLLKHTFRKHAIAKYSASVSRHRGATRFRTRHINGFYELIRSSRSEHIQTQCIRRNVLATARFLDRALREHYIFD